MNVPNIDDIDTETLAEIYVNRFLSSIQQPVCCYQVREVMQNDVAFSVLMHKVKQELLDAITEDVMVNLPPHLVACNIDAH
jgi:hypothetical protein